ncbi:MAG TPA: DUF2461 domain-containing protein [Cyclobacteriaceae bacterium]|nr:DUF2461 domain-containing protein [Cyclobacteriaceae bacterium]
MNNSAINKSTLDFLKKLSKNNNREWFEVHKEEYLEAKENAETFMDALIAKMNVHDQLDNPSGKKSLYRIYNDVRFSKNKAPYNPRFAGYLRRVKPMLRGGYYIWIRPGDTHIGCGFSYPNPEDLKRIRMDIESNYDEWNKLLNSRSIKSNFGEMMGEKVKTAPRGFAADHPAIELLKFKQYWFEHSFTDEELLAKDFVGKVNKVFMSIRPFFDYMSDVLTTDLNGESLY